MSRTAVPLACCSAAQPRTQVRRPLGNVCGNFTAPVSDWVCGGLCGSESSAGQPATRPADASCRPGYVPGRCWTHSHPIPIPPPRKPISPMPSGGWSNQVSLRLDMSNAHALGPAFNGLSRAASPPMHRHCRRPTDAAPHAARSHPRTRDIPMSARPGISRQSCARSAMPKATTTMPTTTGFGSPQYRAACSPPCDVEETNKSCREAEMAAHEPSGNAS